MNGKKVLESYVDDIVKYEIVGNLIPKNFFVTKGYGESDNTIHAGSFHIALRKARIEPFNIQTYSSILPAIPAELKDVEEEHYGNRDLSCAARCEELSIEDGLAKLMHGQELQTIMAKANVRKWKRATAGIIYARFEADNGADRGGLVCEYSNEENPEEQGLPEKESVEKARSTLIASLKEVHSNGSWKDSILQEPNIIIESFVPNKRYGSALVALCFVDFVRPVYRSLNRNGKYK